MTQTANRHPVDQLADVRAEIAKLKEREDALREMILSGECQLFGDDFRADVSTTTSERVDTKALRKALGDKALAPYLKPSTVRTVRLKPRLENDDDEA